MGTWYLIPLTSGLEAKVDASDYHKVSRHCWYAKNARGYMYASRDALVNGKRKRIMMHRMLLGARLGQMVDHRNTDTLDNRRQNLRFCTKATNGMNGKSHTGSTSIYKGVYWSTHHKKWIAAIKSGGSKNYLGYFHNQIRAAKAYDVAAHKLFGEFARPNFA
jgi:hypothetical protein